jgi:glucosamine-phosphate N-acetyltransferase
VIIDTGEAAWTNQFNALRAQSHSYYTIVIVDKDSDKIVAVGTVFIERKFLRGLGSVGHIEDIAVDKAQQGKKLGLRIIQALTHISESIGCYKTILNCSEDNIREFALPRFVRLADLWVSLAFYEKCGYTKKEVEMVRHSFSSKHFQVSNRL